MEMGKPVPRLDNIRLARQTNNAAEYIEELSIRSFQERSVGLRVPRPIHLGSQEVPATPYIGQDSIGHNSIGQGSRGQGLIYLQPTPFSW